MKLQDGGTLLILGLTGSIGMGKSTVAQMFKDENIPVFNADDAVHTLYKQDNILKEIETLFPGTVKDNAVNRVMLSSYIINKPENLKKLEELIHPHVRINEQEFLKNAYKNGADIVLIDSPLLFETGGQNRVDYTIVVSAGLEIQKERVLARPQMNEEKLNALLERQMSDEEKKSRADFILDTAKKLEETKNDIHLLIHHIRTDLEKKLNLDKNNA